MRTILSVINLLPLLIFLLTACQNRKAETEEADKPFHDVRLAAEEGQDSITVVLQYRKEGPDGEAEALTGNAKVELDGVALTPDSARQGGIYYERTVAAAGFEGQHKISFVDAGGKRQEASFTFAPPALEQDLPAQIKKQPFGIPLKNISSSPAMVHLVMTDTSFVSKDVNEEMRIDSAVIRVSNRQLARLAKGPVVMEIFFDQETPLKDAGRLLITYSLRREFELVD